MLLAALSLLALFAFPMWKIVLYAPQYPDGVEMHIWINKIGGTSPGTLQNVNILNHYVGMQAIEPDAIPELQYFQYVIMGMVALGLLIALMKKRSLFLAWTVLLIVICLLGMYDFYLWEYDYGHNLSDTAPIKIPGASFQPPLLGKKDILNFVAVSLPHIAGYFVGLAMALGFGAWWLGRKTGKNEKAAAGAVQRTTVGLLA
jgi:copper chaperone NosL